MKNNTPEKESTRKKIGDGILTFVVEMLILGAVVSAGLAAAVIYSHKRGWKK